MAPTRDTTSARTRERSGPFPGHETNLSAWVPEPEAGRTAPALDPVQSKMLEVLGYLQ